MLNGLPVVHFSSFFKGETVQQDSLTTLRRFADQLIGNQAIYFD